VVGYSCDRFSGCNGRAFVWDKGSGIAELTALVEPPFDGQVYNAFSINERGQIAAIITLPTLPGVFHMAVLVPDGDCDTGCEQRLAENQNRAATRPATAGTSQTTGGRGDWIRTLNKVRHTSGQ
jgi:hypothetical protein